MPEPASRRLGVIPGVSRVSGLSHDYSRFLDERTPKALTPVVGAMGRWWPWPVGIAITILTWPIYSIVPSVGLDPSWGIGLHLAATQGMDFGSQIVFTYGPLGFLTLPTLAPGVSGGLALLFTAVLRLTLSVTLLFAARRGYTAILAIPLAYVLCVLTGVDTSESLALLAALWTILVLERRVPDGLASRLPWAFGAFGAVCLLIKVNVGVVAAIVLLIGSVWLPPGHWRSIWRFGAAFLTTFVVLWLATRNDLLDIPRWLRYAWEVAAGYSSGLAVEETNIDRSWEYPAYLSLVAALLVLVFLHSRRWELPRRLALGVVTTILAYALFKHGFVRHDAHSVFSFAALSALPVAFALRRWLRVVGLAVICAGLVMTFRAFGADPVAILDPSARIDLVGDQLGLVIHADDRHRAVDNAGRFMTGQLGIDRAILLDVDGRTVHVTPYETSAVLAYGLRWRPLPVFQSYQAYTSGLDELNERTLAGPTAPQIVLREDTLRIDGHAGPWESPGETFGLLCNYRVAREAGAWQELAHVANRCGASEKISSVEANANETIRVPEAGPGEVVYAEIHPRPSIADRLEGLLYKPAVPVLEFSNGQRASIPQGLAGRPLIMRAPPDAGFPPGFQPFMNVDAFVIDETPPLRVDFYRLRLAHP
jgi:hypothetical protein